LRTERVSRSRVAGPVKKSNKKEKAKRSSTQAAMRNEKQKKIQNHLDLNKDLDL
jgi:hypothetical protein